MKKQKIKYPDHRGMILSPLDWPHYPRLPLKRPVQGQNWPQLAVIWASTECMTPREDCKDMANPYLPFTIYIMTMYEKMTEDTPSITYINIQALLDDGWQVD